MASRLQDKVAIVTGGAKGIGRHYSLALAAQGAQVMIADLVEGADVVAEIDKATGRAAATICDVANEASVKAMVAETIKVFGRIDILVNNAALYSVLTPRAYDEWDADLWDKVMAVNATGTYLVTKAFLPAMIDNGWGRIVNMSSVSAQRGGGVFGKVPYSSAKAAILGFTKALAREIADTGVTVNAVTPGAVDTNIRVGATDESEAALAAGIPVGRTATTEEVAAVITFLSSEDASYLTGTTVDINGGSHIH